MRRWLRHAHSAVFIAFGLLVIKASVWLYEPKVSHIVFSAMVFLIGVILVIAGIDEYVKMLLRWHEKRKRIKEEQLRKERLKKLLEEEEKRREEQRRRTAELMKSLNRIQERYMKYPETVMETTGQILKRLGIKREKRRKVKSKKALEIKKPKPEKPKYSVLEPLIQELMSKRELYIDRNMHYGKLRGKDIARALAKELKRRGIEYEIKWGDYDAYIKIERG